MVFIMRPKQNTLLFIFLVYINSLTAIHTLALLTGGTGVICTRLLDFSRISGGFFPVIGTRIEQHHNRVKPNTTTTRRRSRYERNATTINQEHTQTFFVREEAFKQFSFI